QTRPRCRSCRNIRDACDPWPCRARPERRAAATRSDVSPARPSDLSGECARLKARRVSVATTDSVWSSGLLGGDEVVDALAQVLEHEILLGRGLAFVDFLRPLLERQLDAESLVDREGDVEEGERIDAEIVDGVALGRDLLARNVAGLGNDSGDRLERSGHAGAPVLDAMEADDIRARRIAAPAPSP